MIFKHLLDAHARYGNASEEICWLKFKCDPGMINEDVILAPFWPPDLFTGLVDSITFFEPPGPGPAPSPLWTLNAGGKKISYIKTGVGAPVTIDSVFSLSQTPCKNIVFIGAVGALNTFMKVGDIVIPEYSVCGDGASRYLTTGKVQNSDCFGEKYYPDPDFYNKILSLAKFYGEKAQVGWHTGKTFSVDTIFAEFAHLEEIVELGCDSIEMETAALFKAASVCGIKTGAVFIVSDNVYVGKSLYIRSQADADRRDFVRNQVLTRIALDSLLT
jgi:purine-nucleoside phosphorylase